MRSSQVHVRDRQCQSGTSEETSRIEPRVLTGRSSDINLNPPTHYETGFGSLCRRVYADPSAGRFWRGSAAHSARADSPAESDLRLSSVAALVPVVLPDSRSVKRKTTGGPTFFTERSLAVYLAVSDRTVRNWIRRGDLPSYKLGASRRIDPADVDAFLVRRREESA